MPGHLGAAGTPPPVVEEVCEGKEGAGHPEGDAGRLPDRQDPEPREAQGGRHAGDDGHPAAPRGLPRAEEQPRSVAQQCKTVVGSTSMP